MAGTGTSSNVVLLPRIRTSRRCVLLVVMYSRPKLVLIYCKCLVTCACFASLMLQIELS